MQSWDTAYKSGSENDYSVCTTWGVKENAYYLLSYWRGRVDFPELKRLAGSLAKEWVPNSILVEDAASGQSLIQELRHESMLPIIPVKVDRDKMARAQAVTPLIEAGKVFLPESAQWRSDYVDELASFPTGIHDDAVDSTTQGPKLHPPSASAYCRGLSATLLNRIMVTSRKGRRLPRLSYVAHHP